MRPTLRHRNVPLRPLRTAAAGLAALGAVLAAAPAARALPAAPGAADASPALPAEYLPSDHPAWRDLEAVWVLGGLDGLPLFTRPLARADVAAAVAGAAARSGPWSGTEPLRRLQREFAAELDRLGAPGAFRETPAPFETVAGRAVLDVRAEGAGALDFSGDDADLPAGTAAALVARVYLPQRAFVLADLGIEKILDANPLGDAVVKGSDWYLSTRSAYLSVRTEAVDLAAGLLRNRWGPGRSGTLLLSDAALSYPAVFYGRTFGPRLRFVALTAALHQPENRWYSAHRIEFAAAPNLRIGLQESAAYASDGADLLYVTGIIPYTLVQRILDRTTSPGGSVRDHRNNVMTGIDIVWRIAPGWRADGELLIDDLATESSSMPHRIAFQGGLAWTGRTAGGTTEARAEFVKVYRYTYAVFYGADHIRDGIALGYGPGNDLERAEAWVERDFGLDARFGLGLDAERRGEGRVGDFWDPAQPEGQNSGATLSGVVERTLFPHVRAELRWRDIVTARARAGAAIVRNPAHVAGTDDTTFRGRLEASFQW